MPNKKDKNQLKDIPEEIDTFDTMLSALVELLEEKGILTQQEWENRIKQKIEKAQDLTRYRDIQFYDGTVNLKEGKNSTKPTYPDIAILENRGEMVSVHSPIDFQEREKGRKLRVAIETAKTGHKKKPKSTSNTLSEFYAWNWLKMTRKEMDAKSKQIGKNKCIVCGRNSTKNRSSILCQWHYAAFTKWRKRVDPNYP